MIPLHKLRRLPRHQRLRKIVKLLEIADAALAGKDRGNREILPSRGRTEYLVEIVRLLAEDDEFSQDERNAIVESRVEMEATFAIGLPLERRVINRLRHLVSQVIGKQVADWDFIDESGCLKASARKIMPGFKVFLDEVRSPFNVGSIFRTAESFGISRLFLSHLCASPTHPRAERSSMGCVGIVPWEHADLEDMEGPFFALETQGTPIDRFRFPSDGVLIVGSEELGVSPKALARADASLGRVTIPTIGSKGSLNVAVAFGIAMHAWCARFNESSEFPA